MSFERKNFDLNLREGVARESAFTEAVASAHVEHKCDKTWPPVTGNICLEYQQATRDGGTQPSGIAIPDAPWWAIEYANDWWVVTRRANLAALALRGYGEGRIKRTGDNANVSVLVPIEWCFRPWESLAVPRDVAA